MGPINSARDPLTDHFPAKMRFSTCKKKKKKRETQTQTQMRLVSSVPKRHLSVSLVRGKSGVLWVCVFLARSHALFMGPASTYLINFSLKLDLKVLLTHLKIILL